MKLCRIKTSSGIRPAILDANGQHRDLSEHVSDLELSSMAPDALDALRRIDPKTLPEIEGEYAPVLNDIRRILCIGLNYSDHAAEAGMPVPDHPILFAKLCAATGANEPIIIPKDSEKTDWEVELAVIIGTKAQHVSEADALSHVAGYATFNDVSERAFQIEFGGQWVKGKSCDTFAPIGPWLVTKDEVPDPQNLDLWLDVNGTRRQTGNTSTMVFSVAEIISFLSRFMTLLPGDVIATGTPPGVGMGFKPPVYLQPGDVVELGISGIGDQKQNVISFKG
ncbi:fumarylacetoacetate hydrolase family protein [Roseobacter sp. GAI101]|uniref:fumarylacetoacetate hydrolase family protein n=1 Tax=Roseobacter sp. (strain GAI101) TaxID=391589 RepID=UPI0001871A9A|nr:fumarylacetoacetate hydrolase family protein [Roseobacter sp. GAI101]EEB86002.1 5-carboxymethyl-2-hydroxymuconate delta-isomerase [Roseobacter sp. GAI101]